MVRTGKRGAEQDTEKGDGHVSLGFYSKLMRKHQKSLGQGIPCSGLNVYELPLAGALWPANYRLTGLEATMRCSSTTERE